MPETLNSCPLCSGGQFSIVESIKDYSVSGEAFQLQSCNTCSLRLTNPRPTEEEIGPYYATELYISHTDAGNSPINKIYKQVRRVTLSQKVDLLNNLLPRKGKVLDVGCGTGYFLDSMEAAGWDIAGVEVDSGARELACQRLNLTIAKNIFDVDSEKYNAITLWHVLEHIHELDNSLNKITELLNHNGKLILALPNWQSNDAKAYGKYWAAWDVPRHLYHFSPSSVEYLAEKYSLKVEAIKPMKFDAYYVSLLSEQYKNGGILSYPKAMLSGLLSNIKASSSGQYSSLIYVLRKQHA